MFITSKVRFFAFDDLKACHGRASIPGCDKNSNRS